MSNKTRRHLRQEKTLVTCEYSIIYPLIIYYPKLHHACSCQGLLESHTDTVHFISQSYSSSFLKGKLGSSQISKCFSLCNIFTFPWYLRILNFYLSVSYICWIFLVFVWQKCNQYLSEVLVDWLFVCNLLKFTIYFEYHPLIF